METTDKDIMVPILKKDALIPIEIQYQDAAGLVQVLFSLANRWTKEEREDFKNILEKKQEIKSPEQICYLIIDGLYRRILLKAKELDMVEMTNVTKQSPLMPAPTNPPQG